jgi:hypothetical protein
MMTMTGFVGFSCRLAAWRFTHHRRRFLHDARNISNLMTRSSAKRPRVLAFSPKPSAAGETHSSPAVASIGTAGITQFEFLQGKACSLFPLNGSAASATELIKIALAVTHRAPQSIAVSTRHYSENHYGP